MKRTDPAMVTGIVYDLRAPLPRSATGYGAQLPTPYRIRYGVRWHRVYAMNYGNAGSVYIRSGSENLFLDIATEYALSAGLTDATLGLAR
jgi:hypothetical protein